MATSTYTPQGTYNDAGLTAAQQAQIAAEQAKWVAAQKAGDQVAMDQAHANAENIRATAFGNSGYSGGLDGSDYIPINNTRGGQTGSNLSGLLGQLNPNGTAPTTPQTTGLPLGDQYGINYDMNSILGILNNATDQSFNVQRQQQQQAQNNYFNDMYATQGTTLDTLKQAQAKAIATGASKGISAANELSSILNLQTTTAKQANDLANASNNLSAQQQAATALNASTALNTSNQLKQAIGQLDMTKYGYDVQNSIGILDYLASLAQTAGGIIDSENNLAGTKYNADQNLAGTQYNADYGYGGSKNPYYGQSTQGGGYTGGGGGGYTGGGSNTGDGTGTGSETGNGTEYQGQAGQGKTAEQTGQPITLTFSNSTIQKASDGTWTLNTYDANGKPTQMTGLNDTQKTAIVMEGDPAVLDEGYQRKIWGKDIHNGDTVEVNGVTYTYSSVKNLWVSSHGTPWGARNLKTYKDRVDKEAKETTPYNPTNPTPPHDGWTTSMQPGYEWKELDDHGNNWYGPK